MKIIDTHVHLGDIYGLFDNFDIFDQKFKHSDRPSPYERLKFRNIYGGKLNYLFKPLIASSARSMTRYANLPNLLQSMQKSGVSQSIVLALEPFVKSDVILNICQNNPSLIPFCSIHPLDRDKKEKIKRYVTAGAKGLKLHPVIQRILPDSLDTLELLEEVAPYNIPVLYHVGWGSIGRGSYGMIDNYRKILRSFPRMKFIFAHMGFYEPIPLLDMIENCPNVYCDTSWQPAGIIKKAIAKLGKDRIIFGSDWPYNLQQTSLNIILKLTEDKPQLREKILHKNIERIISAGI